MKKRQKMMLEDADAGQKWIKNHPNFKVPILINGSIHGNEYIGTDAVMELIEIFAYEDDKVTKKILDNEILVFNVIANPDGRIAGTRHNDNEIELNRDNVHESQPESKALIDLQNEWYPTVFLDLHGYVNLIEPNTGPHNPNNEHDLYIKWGLKGALAMEQAVLENQKEDYEHEVD